MNFAKADRVQASVNAALRDAFKSSSGRIRVLLAYSGGCDSHVMLQALATASTDLAIESLRAVYIDHQMQSASAMWASHCEQVCRNLAVDFQVQAVSVVATREQGPEAAARAARYAALHQILQKDELLLTAHHADDQAETLMLQLLRGSGVQGLAAMPARCAFGRGYHLRPLLQIPQASLQLLAQHWQLGWIDDPSNLDTDLDRNMLRHHVMPLLKRRWPALTRSLARSASHCAEAAELCHRLALRELGGQLTGTRLALDSIKSLPTAERRNAIRQWIHHHQLKAPSTRVLAQIEIDLVQSNSQHSGDVQWSDAQMRHYAGQLYLGPRGSLGEVEAVDMVWANKTQALNIPALDTSLDPALIPESYQGGELRVHSRRGGERLRLPGRSHSTLLKHWLQQNRVPPWNRNRLLLFSEGNQLLGYHGNLVDGEIVLD